jgi:hypothetical protein
MPTAVPPSPDTSKLPRHKYEVLECVYSCDNRYRAVLLRDDLGLFRVSCDKWDLSQWVSSGYAFWNPVGRGLTIVDSLENARLLARQRLLELGVTVDSAGDV